MYYQKCPHFWQKYARIPPLPRLVHEECCFMITIVYRVYARGHSDKLGMCGISMHVTSQTSCRFAAGFESLRSRIITLLLEFSGEHAIAVAVLLSCEDTLRVRVSHHASSEETRSTLRKPKAVTDISVQLV